jgi:uncharacterized protein (UPF0333 family)
MKMLEEKKAQGSVEYLLLIGGVIVIALAVGLYMKSIPPQIQKPIEGETRTAAS